MKQNITCELSGKKRLDIFLSQKFPEKSRNFWQKSIKSGFILVNNKMAIAHQSLKINDKININMPDDEKKTEKKKWKLEIISESKDYIVINKPAGLIVHPTETSKEITLVDLLAKKYPVIKNVGDNRFRPGIVHRLDKNVSGVMVVAKNQESYENLKRQFANRTIKKIYLCLVIGSLNKNEGLIDFKIARSKTSGKMAAKPKSQEGKDSITKYKVIKKWQHYSYLKIFLQTGRTHQIRVHLNAIKHPVVGETLYIPKKLKINKKLDRLFLHASEFEFDNLERMRQSFASPLPKDLENFLKIIK